eukprot:19697-Amphidinium_carterae.2
MAMCFSTLFSIALGVGRVATNARVIACGLACLLYMCLGACCPQIAQCKLSAQVPNSSILRGSTAES